MVDEPTPRPLEDTVRVGHGLVTNVSTSGVIWHHVSRGDLVTNRRIIGAVLWRAGDGASAIGEAWHVLEEVDR